jgi:hypothetical protein
MEINVKYPSCCFQQDYLGEKEGNSLILSNNDVIGGEKE